MDTAKPRLPNAIALITVPATYAANGKVQPFHIIMPENKPIITISNSIDIIKRSNKIFHWEMFLAYTTSRIAPDCSGTFNGTIRNIPTRITDCSRHFLRCHRLSLCHFPSAQRDRPNVIIRPNCASHIKSAH